MDNRNTSLSSSFSTADCARVCVLHGIYGAPAEYFVLTFFWRIDRTETMERLSTLPGHNCDYLSKGYWNLRYISEDNFEWCKGYQEFKPLITKYVGKNDRVLILGCGNSSLGAEMFSDGFQNIINIDFSEVVIEKMTKRYPQMQWFCKDMRTLEGDADLGQFDVIIEKGTLDVLFVKDKSPWEASPTTKHDMKRTTDSIYSLLRPGGRFVSVTFTQPHFRLKYYQHEEYKWKINYETFGEGFHYFFYVATRECP
ncbi:endothelin-converting enzyme 2-like isoform X5 [Varroa jacobsoni]|uniref:endothelin-converting enzyme 2-like isoform X5 n=1 Tax=Varroa jacobsoni TaxID=62625 RepID=UPI000BF4E116|nr:endothelin-converting enzyme 2-like isoform X5 [Varroa jacobsoni]